MNKLKVVYLDGSEQETTAGARAEVEFERKNGKAFGDAFRRRTKDEPRGQNEWLYYLAWVSLRVQEGTFKFSDDKQRDEEFDDWLGLVADVDVLGGAEPDPTGRGRRPEKSSNSAS